LNSKKTYAWSFTLVSIVLLICFVINLSFGSVRIPLTETLHSIFGGVLENTSWEYIIWNYRLPKAFTATIVGGGLALSGLLMQTLFRNPLAGPFVLGISSGASLGAALLQYYWSHCKCAFLFYKCRKITAIHLLVIW